MIKIGELAKTAGCQVVTVRYYEKEGLLGKPERTEKNYRLYDEADLERLKFIMHCRKHDMKLSEIRNLLDYRDNPTRDCLWVNELIDRHIENAKQRMESLRQLVATLQELRASCAGQGRGDTCGILKTLADADLCACGNEAALNAREGGGFPC